MNLAQEFCDLRALWKVGDLYGDQLIAWAEIGVASDERLLPLAILARGALEPEIERACQEVGEALGVKPLSQSDATYLAIRAVCKQVVEGRRDPVSGATRLATLAYSFPQEFELLSGFIADVDSIEDGTISLEAGRERISRAMRDILKPSPPTPAEN